MALVPEIKPTSGVAGNVGSKYEKRRAEFDATHFSALIEQKGYRLAWQRAAECPCVSVNDQTRLWDPNCPLCKAKGWFYFAPTEPVLATNVGELTPIQAAIAVNAGVIRGIMTSLRNERQPYNEIGNWQFGDTTTSVRWQNKLGYYDKLTNLDSEVVYAEAVTTDGAAILPTRYRANQVNLVRSVARTYEGEVDFEFVAGQIVWNSGKNPGSGLKLTLHYLCHPTWIVVDHPHAIRTSMKRIRVKNPVTPQGDPQPLPLQAHTRLEFVP